MVRIGFTGTQEGMTVKQRLAFITALMAEVQLKLDRAANVGAPWFEFHHGDCIGADEEAHTIVRSIYGTYAQIHIHPPEIQTKRAHLKADVPYAPQDYLVRNKEIVICSEFIFAAPMQNQDVQRSGTWSTIRYAHKQKTPCAIILNNGTIRWAENFYHGKA